MRAILRAGLVALGVVACVAACGEETGETSAPLTGAQAGQTSSGGGAAAGKAGAPASSGQAGAQISGAGAAGKGGSQGGSPAAGSGGTVAGSGGAVAGSAGEAGAAGAVAGQGGQGEAGSAGASGDAGTAGAPTDTGGAGGESGAGGGNVGAGAGGGEAGSAGSGGSPEPECLAGQHQGCECPIAGEIGLQGCTPEGTWGACEGCPDYPVPVEGVDYALCENSGNKVGQCADSPGYYGCVTDFDDSFFEIWVGKHCKQQGAAFLCCDVPSACDRVAVNAVEPGVVLTCDEYGTETGVKVTHSECAQPTKPCSVVRPTLSACWAMCIGNEAEQKCPSAGMSKCESIFDYDPGGPGAFTACCSDI